MSILYRAFSHLALSLPIESPFFPQIDGQNFKLNKGYIIDYYAQGDNGLKVIPVEGCEQSRSLGTKLYIYLKWSADSFKIDSASIAESASGSVSDDSVYIPLLETDTKGIKEIYVRENIHWMMIPKPKDKNKAGVVVFDIESEGPGGKGKIKWLQFESANPNIEVVGGSKEKVKLIPTSKCPDEDDQQTE